MELQSIESVSYEKVRRVLKKRTQAFEKAREGHPAGAEPEFVAQMGSVLDVYRRPYDARFPVAWMNRRAT